MISYDTQSRLITQEGTWEKKEISRVDVRKIKKSSYQYYFKYPDEQSGNNSKDLVYRKAGKHTNASAINL